MPKSSFQYIPFLDGLRALAILWVMGFHSQGSIAGWLSHNGGWVGVDVFFVISGFLITSILLAEQQATNSISLPNFYARRALRLIPAYYLSLAALYFFNPCACPHMAGAVGIAALYLSNYDMVFGWGHVVGSGAETSWSLAVEEQFYLAWPSVLNNVRKHLAPIAVAVIVLCQIWKGYLLAHGADWLRISAGFDTKIDVLMFGCLAGIAVSNLRVRLWLQKHLVNRWIAPVIFVALLLYERGVGHGRGPVTFIDKIAYWDLRLPILAVLVALLIISLIAQPRSPVVKLLANPVATWIGRISYSIYLWHILAFTLVIKILGQPLNQPIFELTAYLAAIALASLSYYIVELPFLRLKSRFNKKQPPVDLDHCLEEEMQVLSRA